MRTSSYTIYVDLPETPEEVLLVHGYTGAYDEVSRDIANYLRSMEVDARAKPLLGEWDEEPRPAAAPTPSAATIETLRRRGFLTELSVDDERALVKRFATKHHDAEIRSRAHHILMPTYQCNLRCAYCFQDHMRTDPAFAHLLRSMSKEMFERVLSAMAAVDANHPGGEGKPRSVTIFGGEPLLAENRELIEYVVARLHEVGPVEISAVTNGTDLDQFIHLLGPDKIEEIQVTLDGPPSSHDQRRIYADGSGSFERIAANVSRALAETDVLLNLRINVDRHNVQYLPELAREIATRGWHESQRFSATTEATHSANENLTVRETFTGYTLSAQMKKLRETHEVMSVIARPIDAIRRTVHQVLARDTDPWMMKNSSYCAAHASMYVYDPFGDIYACWERTGDPAIRIGHIEEDGRPVFRHSRGAAAPTEKKRSLPMLGKDVADIDTWRSRSVASNDTCASCKYAFYCGGGCAANALDQKGEFFTNQCNGFQKSFVAAAAEAYLEVRKGIQAKPLRGFGCGA